MEKEVILLIEDDADIREGVRILLESEGYAVQEAQNGAEGLSMLSDEIDLVILDVMMPGISASEPARKSANNRMYRCCF